MGKLDILTKRNDNARKYHINSKSHRNCIRVSKQNTLFHELEKFLIAMEYIHNGNEVLTEANNLKKTRRFDLVVLDTNEIVEIETDSKIIKKDADKIVTFETKCNRCGNKAILVSYLIRRVVNAYKICRSYKCINCQRHTVLSTYL